MTCFGTTKKRPPSMNSPPDDAPITRAEFDQLRKQLAAIERRGTRTETRLMRLLEHHGLGPDGKPVPADR